MAPIHGGWSTFFHREKGDNLKKGRGKEDLLAQNSCPYQNFTRSEYNTT